METACCAGDGRRVKQAVPRYVMIARNRTTAPGWRNGGVRTPASGSTDRSASMSTEGLGSQRVAAGPLAPNRLQREESTVGRPTPHAGPRRADLLGPIVSPARALQATTAAGSPESAGPVGEQRHRKGSPRTAMELWADRALFAGHRRKACTKPQETSPRWQPQWRTEPNRSDVARKAFQREMSFPRLSRGKRPQRRVADPLRGRDYSGRLTPTATAI